MKQLNGWHILLGIIVIGAISASNKELQAPFACAITAYIIYFLLKK